MRRSLIGLFAVLLLFMACALATGSTAAASKPQQVKSFSPVHVPVIRRQGNDSGTHPQSGVARKSRRAPFTGFSSSLTSFHFLAASELAAGVPSFYTAVVGDYNGDSRKDVATVVSSDFGFTFSLSAMLGNGDGTFGAAQLTSISFASTDRVYSAKLTAGISDDIIVVHTGSFDVFLSNGDGTFAAPVNYADGIGSPAAALLSDIDGNGKVDLIVTDGVSVPEDPTSFPMVSVLLGNGDGTFQAMTQTTLPGQLPSGVFSDVDGDSFLDLVGATQVFFGSALGTFQAPVTLTTSNGQPNSCAVMDGAMAVADVNDDLLTDIVTADCQNDTVTVYLNAGGQNFQPGVSYFAGNYPQGIGIADVDSDGAPDVIASNADSSNITVLRNVGGTGNLQVPESGYAIGGFGYLKPLIADFDGDSRPDVMVANYIPEFQFTLSFLHSFGDGSFSAAADYFAKPSPGSFVYGTGIASADFNNDSRADFVRGNASNSGAGVAVFITNLDSTMHAAVNYGSGNYNYVKTGDFDGDTRQDIIAVDDAGSAELFLGNGDGTFQIPQIFPALAVPAEGMVVGDFNHDTKPDVAITGSGNVAVLLNNGLGGFAALVTYAITSSGVAMAAADLNGDGNLDLVVPLAGSNFASILTGNSDGTFQALADVDLGFTSPQAIAIGDFNGDGRQDLAVTIDDFSASMGMDIVLGNGNGTFGAGTLYASTNLSSTIGPPLPGGVQAVDLDGDGALDLVYDNSEYENAAVMFGNGDGTFLAPLETPVGGYPVGLILADVDGDGSQDLVTSNASFAGITVLLNTSGSSIGVVSSVNPADPLQVFVLTATVSASGHNVMGVPTGTVTFTEGVTTLGTSTLSGGMASLSLTESLDGDHTITATYSGDASFRGKATDFVETINQIGFSPNYTLSANPTSAVLQVGQSANFTITVAPTNGFNGQVNFTCGTLPAGVSCQFTPSSVTPTNGPVQVQLVISSVSVQAVATRTSRFSLLASLTVGFFGLILVEGVGRKHSRAALMVLALLSLGVMLATISCGGNNAAIAPHVNSSQAIQVVANGPGAGTTHALNIMLTIQQ